MPNSLSLPDALGAANTESDQRFLLSVFRAFRLKLGCKTCISSDTCVYWGKVNYYIGVETPHMAGNSSLAL